MTSTEKLLEIVISLQTANSIVISDFVNENVNYKSVPDIVDTINNLTNKSWHLVNRINVDIENMQCESSTRVTLNQYHSNVVENLMHLNNIILDIRRKLSYICAASDMMVPNRKKRSIYKLSIKKSSSYNKQSCDVSRNRSCDDPFNYPKSTDTETWSRTDKNSPKSQHMIRSEQGAIKKCLKYTQKGSNSKTLEDSEEKDDKKILVEQRKNKPRRGLRSQNSSDRNKSSSDKVYKEPNLEEKLLLIDSKLVEK